MKQFIFIALLSFSFASLSAQDSGINFIENESWETILKKAKENNRIIFVDAYATWCGPCKAMDKEVFPLASVGEFYNVNFMNVKLDVERGDGPAVAARYGVQVIPTYLFIDGNGELVHSGLGYLYEDDLIDLGKVALDPNLSIGGMRAKFNAGDRDPDFLLSYATALAEASDPKADEAVQAYLETQENLLDPTNMEFILLTVKSTSSPYFDFILESLGAFSEIYGPETVVEVLQSAVFEDLYSADPQPEVLYKADAMFRRTVPEDAALMSNVVRIIFHMNTENWEAYSDEAIKYFQENMDEIGWGELNEHAWHFYEYIDDEAKLATALEWARKSVEMNENYYNLDTLAHLYVKVGKRKEAKVAAKAAIEIAKETGDDYTSTEELLNNM